MINWKGFKSGSDIRGFGIADETEPLYLSDTAVDRIVRAFALRLSEKTGKKCTELFISVGHDSRVSAQRIKNAVISALSDCGVKTVDCALSSTPAMFFTTVDLKCDAAIQITASHHPMDKNGLKFFTPSGGLEGSDIADILDRAERKNIPLGGKSGEKTAVDFMKIYSARLRRMICKGLSSDEKSKPLSGFKIAVDAGNGAGGFYAYDVLEPLGADISGSRFLEPDGTFPNHIPNPENSAAMDFACSATVSSGSDLGVIFDTDVDRAGCVGSDGMEINRNRLVAIAAYIALEGKRGATVVTDSVTSDGLAKFIADLGGVHLRFKRGYKNVINKQLELTKNGIDCPLAIETSGHAAFAENYFLDDGAYLITKIIILMAKLRSDGKTISSIVAPLQMPVEEKELRFKILTDNFRQSGENYIAQLHKFAESLAGWTEAPDSYEGVRFSTCESSGDGWILARLSVHDPVIVVNSESNKKGGTDEMLSVLLAFTSEFKDIQI